MKNPSAIFKSNVRPLENNENKQRNKKINKRVYIFILKIFLEGSIFTHVHFFPSAAGKQIFCLYFVDDINSCLKNFIVYSQKK